MKTHLGRRTLSPVEDGQGVGVIAVDHGLHGAAPHLDVVCLSGGKRTTMF